MLVICSAIAARADGQPAVDRKLSRHAKVMGTVVSLTVWGQDERTVASAARAVFDEFDRVNMLMSSWLEESAVARINSAAGNGKFVQVDKEVMSVIVMSQQASKASKGAFDITVGSFRGLWKFDEDIDGSIPDAKAVKARKKLVNYRDLTVDAKRNRVKLKRKGQRITLGGVAKGYAVDRAVKILRERGVVDFILQAGGDLYVAGANAQGVLLTDGESKPKLRMWNTIDFAVLIGFLDAMRSGKSAHESLSLGYFCLLVGDDRAEQYFEFALLGDDSRAMKDEVKALRGH